MLGLELVIADGHRYPKSLPFIVSVRIPILTYSIYNILKIL